MVSPEIAADNRDKGKQPDEENLPEAADVDLDELLLETDALATYVARHGDVLAGHEGGQDAFKELLQAHSAAAAQPDSGNWKVLMEAYAKLTEVTYGSRGVNGRTVLDTRGHYMDGQLERVFSPRYRPLTIGVMLFAAALMFELLSSLAGGAELGTAESKEWLTQFGKVFVNSLAPFLIPAAWGGIGGCVFLTKRVSDKLFEMAYEESRVKGDATRIFLGAMLGVIIVVLFFPDFSDQIKVGEVTFGPATAAFIAGLGVKPVYTAFEVLSESLSKWISSGR